MISEISVAMVNGLGLGAVANAIHPHPTRAEAIKQVICRHPSGVRLRFRSPSDGIALRAQPPANGFEPSGFIE